MKLSYKNNGLELLGRSIVWMVGLALIIPSPWVINDMIAYYAKGFTIEK